MLQRFRQSQTHRILTYVVLCVWLGFVATSGYHTHGLSDEPDLAGTARAVPSGVSAHAAQSTPDMDCAACRWLDALHKVAPAASPCIAWTRLSRPLYRVAPLPTRAATT